MSDDVRLDLDLAADAEIDRQVGNPQPIMLLNNLDISGTFLQIVAYKNCADERIPRGIFEARCVARGFKALFIATAAEPTPEIYFTR
jgi:hypothetical protein